VLRQGVTSATRNIARNRDELNEEELFQKINVVKMTI